MLTWKRDALRPLPAVDSLLGATAKVHALILATRNVRDLVAVGLQVVNPFEFAQGSLTLVQFLRRRLAGASGFPRPPWLR